ncbi:kelch repeat-containing protein [Sorangium sp. So ce315]|uniref:kelch repeat-containing protein n=1 Tax=Sorangium sp. So ce315 TaxID=3133299 RepID=UPI003F5E5586
MHSCSLFQRWLIILSSLLFGGALAASGVGCALGPEPPAGDDLRLRFPDQAPLVLETSEAFVAREGGFALASSGDLSRDIDIAAPLQRRGGLRAALPARGEGEIRFQLPGGFEARVRELDAEGEGVIVERAVAYPRKGGTSFWAAIDDGYEEWLLLDAGVASADAPAAAWEVEGATLRQRGDAVEVVDETGTARLRVTAPAAFARGGRPIAAWLTVRGATLELWADAGGEPALVDPVWAPAGTMSAARHSHTATLLQDGKVLVAGGSNSSVLASAERYSPATNTWSSAGSLATARRNHKAVRLSNGKVLVVGGTNLSGASAYASAELYDPATNSWSAAASMGTQRWGHTATLLQDGRVLVTGGFSGSFLTSAELYDPATNSWSAAASLGTSRFGHSATLLQDGRVLVTGGQNGTFLTSAQLYDPSTDSWSSVGAMGTARYYHTATLLQDGRVLVTGGYNPVSLELSSVEIFDPSSLTWAAAPSMSTNRNIHGATLLEDGKVLVMGGTVSQSSSISTATVEVYDPVTNAWTGLQSMSDERTLHTATLLANGRVLVTGGRWHSPSGSVDLASAEVYDPAATLWVSTPSMANAHCGSAATLLHDGRVLVAGADGAWHDTADLYDPATNTWTSAAPMTWDHSYPTMTRLGNNKVLVAGGYTTNVSMNAELYDPATDTWSSVGSSTIARHQHTATLLQDGKVLLIGGIAAGSFTTRLATTTLYDPATNTWTAKASMSTPRVGHTATLLGNGMVLVAGGSDGSTELATAELYDPATNTWSSAASMSDPRWTHSATLLSNGNVMIVGGVNAPINYLASTEIYDPSSNTWTSGPSLSVGRAMHTATQLNDGRLLVAGGWTSIPPNGVVSIASAEIYDPVSNAWTTVNSMNDARQCHAAVLLGDGRVLAVSGSANGTLLSSAEVYSP